MLAGDLEQRDCPSGVYVALQQPVRGVLTEVRQTPLGTALTVDGYGWIVPQDVPVTLSWPAARHIYLTDRRRRQLVADQALEAIGQAPDPYADVPFDI